MSNVYQLAKKFKNKYPGTVAWRLKKNSKIVELHLNPGEKVNYVFVAQKNDNPFDMISTAVVALTNKRIIIGRKRLIFGYFMDTITPDLFNDLKVMSGLFWGKIHIDTVKEYITLSNLDKNSLPEIETAISEFMMSKKVKGVKNKK